MTGLYKLKGELTQGWKRSYLGGGQSNSKGKLIKTFEDEIKTLKLPTYKSPPIRHLQIIPVEIDRAMLDPSRKLALWDSKEILENKRVLLKTWYLWRINLK